MFLCGCVLAGEVSVVWWLQMLKVQVISLLTCLQDGA